jgi:hypothetical protein
MLGNARTGVCTAGLKALLRAIFVSLLTRLTSSITVVEGKRMLGMFSENTISASPLHAWQQTLLPAKAGAAQPPAES